MYTDYCDPVLAVTHSTALQVRSGNFGSCTDVAYLHMEALVAQQNQVH